MKSWLELERRFRTLSQQEPELRLWFVEGDQGTGYRLSMHTSTAAARELEALAALAGDLLRRSVKQKSASLSEPVAADRWWSFLKNNSRAPFKSGEGWSRETIDSAPSHHQHGHISNVAAESANLCLRLEREAPINQKPTVLQWIHDNYLKTIAIAVLTALALAGLRAIEIIP